MVVRHVTERIDALCVAAAGGEVGVIGLDRPLVRDHRVVPAADARVDVRRHVHEVSRTRDQLAQPVGRRDAALRIRRGLDRVHVQVQRAGVVGILRDHRLEGGDDLGRVALGLQLRVVVVPGLQVHQRLGVQDLCIGIVGSRRGKLRGRGRVGFVEWPSIGRRRFRVACSQRLDEGLLARGGLRRELDRALQALPGVGIVGRVHRRIDVRTEHQRRAPPAHRTLRVELGRLQERAFGAVVVETEGQHQALVEPALHLRLIGRDFEAVVTEAVQQRRADQGGRCGSCRWPQIHRSLAYRRGARRTGPQRRQRSPGRSRASGSSEPPLDLEHRGCRRAARSGDRTPRHRHPARHIHQFRGGLTGCVPLRAP